MMDPSRRQHGWRGLWWLAPGVAALALSGGCTDPEENIPPAEVKTVTAYGMTLDPSATPQQVAYVLLRSLAEDVQAAQDHPPRPKDQKAANLITYSIAAVDEIERRILAMVSENKPTQPGAASLGKDRSKDIYRVVNYWAPIVAYYVGSFDQDPQAAMARMRVVQMAEGRTAQVLYEVWPEASRPDADRHQTLAIELVKEKGPGGEYWRVARVTYAPKTTRPAGGAATRPATASAPG